MSGVGAVILAAGRGSRFGGDTSKLLAPWRGAPIIRRVAETALASGAAPVIVVSGYARAGVEAALSGLPLQFLHNARWAEGLSTSLRAGVAALPPTATGALILLGDMPAVSSATLDRLIAALELAPEGARAILPVQGGKRGNPALLARGIFGDLPSLEGDCGARTLFREAAPGLIEIQVDDPGVHLDIDLPASLPKA